MATIACSYIPAAVLGALLLLGVGERVELNALPEKAIQVMGENAPPSEAIDSLDYHVGHFSRAAVVKISQQDLLAWCDQNDWETFRFEVQEKEVERINWPDSVPTEKQQGLFQFGYVSTIKPSVISPPLEGHQINHGILILHDSGSLGLRPLLYDSDREQLFYSYRGD